MVKFNPKLLLVLIIVGVYAFTIGLLIPGFFDEAIGLALTYWLIGRG